MPKERYISAKEAARTLNISMSTLYAYVSRGLIRSEAIQGGKRRRYYAEDIDKLLLKRDIRRNPEQASKEALHWGTPVMDSAITLITDDRLYYRGHDAIQLAATATIEQVASLIWTGELDHAEILFDPSTVPPALTYETMLLHLEMDGAHLSPVESLVVLLPLIAGDDLAAYDLRPEAVQRTGVRILRLMTSVVAGAVPENTGISNMLDQGWCADMPQAVDLINAALILCADHELNASSFTARVVASAGSSPYNVIIAGLTALQGIQHGGHTARVEAFLNEIDKPHNVREVVSARLRRGEAIPGFGHKLYLSGDPRAQALLNMIAETYSDSPGWVLAQNIIDVINELIDKQPTIDFALATLARVLNLPAGSALAIFALGRTVGWIGHALEQYETNRLIRPRARYVGPPPLK